MSEKCTECDGHGAKVISTEKCPQCKGTGKAKSVDLMKLSEKDMGSFLQGGAACDKCGGSGEIQITEPCEACEGRGVFYKCKVCGTPLDQLIDGEEVCKTCGGSQVVYDLDESCDMDEVEVGKLYHAIGNSIAAFGVFVDFNPHVRGLIHSSNITRTVGVGDDVIVYVKDIKKNGNMDLVPKYPAQYQTVGIEKDLPVKISSELRGFVRKIVRIEGEVIQVKQTGGPTIFTISDDDGLVMCAAFERAGERAYPDIDSDMIVTIVGEVSLRDDKVQVEVRSIKKLTGTKKKAVWDRIERAIDKRAEPDDIEFLVESEILEKLRPAMKHVAKEIKKAIIKSKPIVLRHHADADGMTAAVAIERAILPLIREVGGADAEYHYYRRAPSKAPFYEMMDITRDLSFALDDAARHGQKMPFVILVDNGSTEEDTPAMKQAQVYGIDMVVIDHHHPDETVDQYLRAHVNPAHVGGDFGVTTGMLCTEVARMINPGVVDEIKHLPAISAVGDRSDADEARRYIELVSDKYSLGQLKDIALALDFEAFWLKFSSGKNIVDDLMNMGDSTIHTKLVKLLCEQANGMINEQLDACLPNVKSQPLSNGAVLNVLDVEKYAHKFTFPPPGKTSGEVHDRMCRKFEGKPVVTIGFGPDFCVIRSKNVRMNIPQMVRELHDEVVGAGVNGGGHLVVGSIKFVEGMRAGVLSKLVEKISAVEVD
ncbi:MAG TPA: S1 RNA-binding domain-containing protein [Methanosarcinaceae archaeon]|nr:S1 RNA-binding domain-containing protein [Methanosarcinaceae archaeon]